MRHPLVPSVPAQDTGSLVSLRMTARKNVEPKKKQTKKCAPSKGRAIAQVTPLMRASAPFRVVASGTRSENHKAICIPFLLLPHIRILAIVGSPK
jgi:hypothetical protein